MVAPVVRVPGGCVGEPVVCTEVDDQGVSRKLSGDRGRATMRQGQEDDVNAVQLGRLNGPDLQCGKRLELRVDVTEWTSSRGVALNEREVEGRVPGQQAQQLTAGIPGPPDDPHPKTHSAELYMPLHGCAKPALRLWQK